MIKQFTVPDGYCIDEKKKRPPIDTAVVILSGRAQTRVTFAKKDGEEAELVYHQITCPHCRHVLPAYGRFLNEIFRTYGPIPNKLSPEIVEAWGGAQFCLWENGADTLVFNSVYTPNGEYFCPNCHQKSFPTRGTTEVTITETSNTVKISCTCVDLSDLLNIPWKSKAITRVIFPFIESITFNFEGGETTISASDSSGNTFAACDVTCPSDFKNSKLYKLIQRNTLVRRRLRQSFQRLWNSRLPFPESELTPDLFVKLTAYIGFPAGFYNRIPVEGDRYQVEESFRDISTKIHTVGQFCDKIDRVRLPRCKSLKRVLYNTPDLGFYLPEIERLASYFTDVNLLRTLLNRPFTYALMAFFHTYENADLSAFFLDYIQLRGSRHLIRRLEEKHEELLIYALQYSGLNAYSRECERKKWVEKKQISCLPEVPFALPMRSAAILDTKVGEFKFRQLRSKAEYLEAAEQLRNCLGNWRANDNPIIVIRQNKNILGAIEIEGENRIVQARGKHNQPLPGNVIPAYEYWKEKSRLTEGPRMILDDEDDEEYAPRMFTYLSYRWF